MPDMPSTYANHRNNLLAYDLRSVLPLPNSALLQLLRISLGDIWYTPTRWVLALFLGFVYFWSNAQKFHFFGEGVCVDFLKSVRKRLRGVATAASALSLATLSTSLCEILK